MSTSNELTIKQMRKRIAELSGRMPASANPRYLATRLEQLEQMRANGEDTRSRWGTEPHEPVTISLPRGARDALSKLAEKMSTSASRIVVSALRDYAARQKFSALERALAEAGGES